MKEQLLPALEITTGASPGASVIWLHGLGADGHDFAPIVQELELPQRLGLHFVFPHAPSMPVSINGGYVMPAWYDIAPPAAGGKEDEAGIRASQRELEKLIAREKDRGIPAQRIVLAGFSQGGAIALYTALRHAASLAGVIALSTYLPLAETLAREAGTANLRIPIFMAHGVQDAVIRLEQAAASRDFLLRAGYRVEWHEYPMAHTVCAEEIAAVSGWLVRLLAGC